MTRIGVALAGRERCRVFRSSSRVAAAMDGGLTSKAPSQVTLPYDNYVVRIDGRVKSHHRRFIDALREGLYLRDQFPQHDVKVAAMHQSGQPKVPVH